MARVHFYVFLVCVSSMLLGFGMSVGYVSVKYVSDKDTLRKIKNQSNKAFHDVFIKCLTAYKK